MIPLRDNIISLSFPVVTVILIAINVAIFLVTYLPGGEHHAYIVFSYGMIPSELLRGESFTGVDHPVYGLIETKNVPATMTVFSSMFLHGSFFHLIGNMWFLWLFGDNVEDRLGKLRFIVFYFLTGIIAALAHALVLSQSNIPVVGASGAVSGVMGAYFLMYPRAKIETLLFIFLFFTVVSVPAVIFIGLWFIGQVYSGFMSLGYEGAGIAFFAHIGGFVAGLLLVSIFARKNVVQVPRKKTYGQHWDDDYDEFWY